jgi:polyhydroxyalkanoate synthesis regulator phasin
MGDMSEDDARRYMNNLMLRHKEHFDKMFHRKR